MRNPSRMSFFKCCPKQSNAPDEETELVAPKHNYKVISWGEAIIIFPLQSLKRGLPNILASAIDFTGGMVTAGVSEDVQAAQAQYAPLDYGLSEALTSQSTFDSNEIVDLFQSLPTDASEITKIALIHSKIVRLTWRGTGISLGNSALLLPAYAAVPFFIAHLGVDAGIVSAATQMWLMTWFSSASYQMGQGFASTIGGGNQSLWMSGYRIFSGALGVTVGAVLIHAYPSYGVFLAPVGSVISYGLFTSLLALHLRVKMSEYGFYTCHSTRTRLPRAPNCCTTTTLAARIAIFLNQCFELFGKLVVIYFIDESIRPEAINAIAVAQTYNALLYQISYGVGVEGLQLTLGNFISRFTTGLTDPHCEYSTAILNANLRSNMRRLWLGHSIFLWLIKSPFSLLAIFYASGLISFQAIIRGGASDALIETATPVMWMLVAINAAEELRLPMTSILRRSNNQIGLSIANFFGLFLVCMGTQAATRFIFETHPAGVYSSLLAGSLVASAIMVVPALKILSQFDLDEVPAPLPAVVIEDEEEEIEPAQLGCWNRMWARLFGASNGTTNANNAPALPAFARGIN
jgi:hypothetical protein